MFSPVHLFCHVVQRLLLQIGFLGALKGLSALHDVVEVHTGPAIEGSPGHDGQVEKQGLYQQDERHPLVVWKVVMRLMVFGNVVVER